MPRQRKPRSFFSSTLMVSCELHGPHRIIIVSLDGFSIVAADFAEAGFSGDGFTVHRTDVQAPLSEARRAAGDGGPDIDDLPF